MKTLLRAILFSSFLVASAANAVVILWVGAHPDDEMYVAPILAELCPQVGVDCHLLVATDGGKGRGSLPSNWTYSQIATWRANEMSSSASYLDATLHMMNLEDTASSTVIGDLQNWNLEAGGDPDDAELLTEIVADFIGELEPDYIFTFDPRHGVYCHVDHRAVGLLTIAAAAENSFDMDNLFLLESIHAVGVDVLPTPTVLWTGYDVMVPADTAVSVYDADAAGTWDAVGDVGAIHASQFTSTVVGYYNAAYPEGQIVPLLPASSVISNDTRYTSLCPDVWGSPMPERIIEY